MTRMLKTSFIFAAFTKTLFLRSVTNSRVLLTKPRGGGDLVLEFHVHLVQADLGGGAGCKATVGIERDAFRCDVIQRHLHPRDDRLRRIDLPGLTAHAAESDLDIFR